ADGSYIRENGYYKWLQPVREAARRMTSLGFVSLDNQTPIIKHVNDSVDALHILHRELRRGGGFFKYMFQCREIEGYRAFAVPVEEAWRLHNESQKGLSDGARSRFAMSTEWGKLEIALVTEGSTFGEGAGEAFKDGVIVFKIHRSPFTAPTQGDAVIAKRNP